MMFTTATPNNVRPLPERVRYVRRSLSGAELIELGYPYWKGHAVDPVESYRVDVLHRSRNAVVRVRRAYGTTTNTAAL